MAAYCQTDFAGAFGGRRNFSLYAAYRWLSGDAGNCGRTDEWELIPAVISEYFRDLIFSATKIKGDAIRRRLSDSGKSAGFIDGLRGTFFLRPGLVPLIFAG